MCSCSAYTEKNVTITRFVFVPPNGTDIPKDGTCVLPDRISIPPYGMEKTSAENNTYIPDGCFVFQRMNTYIKKNNELCIKVVSYVFLQKHI